ncbi:PilZ domain-containing protein [Clostridium sp. Marseille-P2415]|uniref:PilZ domain-containing protein n=1 Tax=Clostridium sp. Marseille-P2415 TaxID=1805471 RepID=UPI00098841F0|nr:PilZ domain-containing protein [Clostridium sp. Marseille-P2415]
MLKECEKACIYTLDGVFLAEVKVVDSDKDSMGLIVEEKDMDKVNTETVIVFYDGVQGLVTCKCRLSARMKINGDESGEVGGAIYKVPCQIDELVGVEQRRNDLKVRVSFPVMLETSDADGKVTKIPARVKDVSAGGVGFESKQKLAEEQLFSFLFETDTGCTRLKGYVLWAEKLSKEEEPPRYRYGSRFLDMTSYQESMVRKFAFQEQLKRRKIQ